jgi:hypothetical protein
MPLSSTLAIYKGGRANLGLTSGSGRVDAFTLVVCFSIECFCSVVFRSCLAAGASTADRSNASSRQAHRHQLLANYGPQPGTSLRKLSPCFESRLLEWPRGESYLARIVDLPVCTRGSNRALASMTRSSRNNKPMLEWSRQMILQTRAGCQIEN